SYDIILPFVAYSVLSHFILSGMGKRKSPDKAAGREKEWDRVFNALMTLSQNLQKDRRFLEERRKSLHQVIYK
ncbi:UNVERIFIED_CONTAM: hypothetical protein Sindi_0023700, partial [Sesamum indicum]